MPTTFITDTAHYSTVLDLAMKAKKTLWIGTADIKDLYVTQGKTEKPFLGVLAELLGKGVEVRLIHAKEPGPNFRADFDRYPRLAQLLERALCPRVHFKIIVIDQTVCYVGSANLTGAGMGHVSSDSIQEMIPLAKPVSAAEKQKYQKQWHKWIHSKHPYRLSDPQTGVIKGFPENFMDKTIFELAKTNPSIIILTSRVWKEHLHLSISPSAILGRILELSQKGRQKITV